MTHEDCPGVPWRCDGAMKRLTAALDGRVSELRRAQLLAEFDDCEPCIRAFHLEIRIQETVHESCQTTAPPGLKAKITERLARIDLNDIDVTDL